MNILIFGATGFIGKNLVSFLSQDYTVEVAKIDEEDLILINKIKNADVIINAAGVSRSNLESDFYLYNIYHSQRIFSFINKYQNKMYIYFSSIHYLSDSIYGFSKRYNEFLLSDLKFKENNYFLCLRIPSIFGPGMKPNYVSVVATFCNNIANKLESNIVDGEKVLKLLYVGDLLQNIKNKIVTRSHKGFEMTELFPETVEITVNDLFENIKKMEFNFSENQKDKFLNNLFITYNSYLNKI